MISALDTCPKCISPEHVHPLQNFLAEQNQNHKSTTDLKTLLTTLRLASAKVAPAEVTIDEDGKFVIDDAVIQQPIFSQGVKMLR